MSKIMKSVSIPLLRIVKCLSLVSVITAHYDRSEKGIANAF